MKREPVVTTEACQVRAVATILTEGDFLPSLFDCVDSRRQENRGFAQSTLINVDRHDVVGGL